MNEFTMKLTPTGAGSELTLDGTKIDGASAVEVSASVGDITHVTIEYPCMDVTTVEGQGEVQHFCPYPQERDELLAELERQTAEIVRLQRYLTTTEED